MAYQIGAVNGEPNQAEADKPEICEGFHQVLIKPIIHSSKVIKAINEACTTTNIFLNRLRNLLATLLNFPSVGFIKNKSFSSFTNVQISCSTFLVKSSFCKNSPQYKHLS